MMENQGRGQGRKGEEFADIATLPASLIFGALHQAYGPQVAFGGGAGLAVLATILLMRRGRLKEE